MCVIVSTFQLSLSYKLQLHLLSLVYSLDRKKYVCPSKEDYAPCICMEGEPKDGTLSLLCRNRNLNDTQISRILDAFLASSISPLGSIFLEGNRLTRVPSQLNKFPRLSWIDLKANRIQTIHKGAFNFTVQPGISGCQIGLESNNLSHIEQGAFDGILFCLVSF